MKPELRQATPDPKYSFTVRKDIAEQMINNWHYHPEFEILFLKTSSGTWLIGDHVGHYEMGSMVFLGSNLPHCYKHNEECLIRKKTGSSESIGILFSADILGEQFLNLPETSEIKSLMNKSFRGLKIMGETKKVCAQLLTEMLEASPAKRLIKLLTLLDLIAETKQYTPLSSGAFSDIKDNDQKKIKAIFEYTLNHFDEKIPLEQLASLMSMTRHSFCRFFKRKTRKTYIQFLTEVRIGNACKLLIADEKNVSEICYQSGFNNLAHFHAQFLKITGKKPLEYKKTYLKA